MSFKSTPTHFPSRYHQFKTELAEAIDYADALGQRARWMGQYGEEVFRWEHRGLKRDLVTDRQLHNGIKPPALEAAGGKRADAYLRLNPYQLAVDVKFHALGADQFFWLSDDEVCQYHFSLDYYEGLAEGYKSRLVFYVIPVDDPIRAAYVPFKTFLKHAVPQERYAMQGHGFALAQLPVDYWTRHSLYALQLALDIHTVWRLPLPANT